jgi:hypothetical protein
MSNKTADGKFILKAYTRKEMRNIYGVSLRTFNKWTEELDKELGPIIGKFYNVTQVKLIIEKFGVPGIVEL